MSRAQYSPYKIKHLEINRFRGVMTPEPGSMIPQQFVEDSENLVSQILGQLQIRDGVEEHEMAAVAGAIHCQGSSVGSQAFCIGTAVFVQPDEARSSAVGGLYNEYMEIPVQDQRTYPFGVHTYA